MIKKDLQIYSNHIRILSFSAHLQFLISQMGKKKKKNIVRKGENAGNG